MKRMLINATQSEEVRVALVDGQKLYDLDIENRGREQKKASIYKAKITRVEPSLEAAFVEFGADRHGFLPLKEISRQYFKKKPSEGGKLVIQELIAEKQEILVQVDKEERGTKGAALTTFISLAGRYLVLMPNNPRAGGISRRIEGEDRDQLRQAFSQLNIPDGMGVIVRTAGVDRSAEELQWDLEYLLQLWDAIEKADASERAPKLLYQENNVILRAIRDNLRKDIGEVLIDGQEAYDEAKSFIDQVMPQYGERMKFYSDSVPLFNRYQIESQIEMAFQHSVRLPSGGGLVIDPTEALVSIDINSARATKGADIEETALNTNLEAADEICRQLRLRDMGGLIVIDFIDMVATKNQRAVETRMREALDADRARVQVSRISRFGLMEMSRQRLRPSLDDLTTKVCPRCSGQGRIRDTKSLALGILRLMEEEALKERSSSVRALVPLNIASYLLNEKRQDVAEIERRTGTHLVIVPNVNMETPQYDVQRIRDDHAAEQGEVPSYELAEAAQVDEDPSIKDTAPARTSESAVVKAIQPSSPAPAPTAKPAAAAPETGPPGLLKRLVGSLFSDSGRAAEPEAKADQKRPPGRSQRSGEQRSGGRQQSRDRDRDQDRGRDRARQGNGGRGRAKDGDQDRSQSGQEGQGRGRQRGSRGGRNRRDGTSQDGAGRDGAGRDGQQESRQGGRQNGQQGRQQEGRQQEGRSGGQRDKRQPERRDGDQAERRPERKAPQGERPSEEALAESKRRPRRDRSKLEDGDRNSQSRRPAPAKVDSTAEQAPAAVPPAAAAAVATAKAETPKVEAVPQEITANADPQGGQRAGNDPRNRGQAAIQEPVAEQASKAT
ncbi:MAG: Rne/Rng family ribonuclease, partial [Gammaproteobacteria bacterium]|nr:Rne/Rng family ribonuclease [Gammaproteobacteria bacterium]